MKLSIKYKVIIGLLFIFCLGFNLISFVTGKIITKNNKEVISKEFLSSQRDGTFYIKQYLKLNDIEESKEEFEKKTEEIAFSLSLKLDDRVIVYSNDGKFLFDTAYRKGSILGDENNHIVEDNKKDLKLAIDNKSGYSILKHKDRYNVCFSYPLYINNQRIGIVRYIRDYSDIFLSGKYLLRLIKVSVLVVFTIIFLFSIFLSRRITIPIIKLNDISKEIAKGNYEMSASINSNDEIGELNENFNIMKECIKDQITTIEIDRDNLKILESHRKKFFDNVTHELKTPLTIISGYSQIMIDKGFNDKNFFQKAINRMKNEADRMHSMVLKLLDISKMESNVGVKYERLNISKLIYKLCEDMEIKSQKYGINIDKNIHEDVYIHGSAEQMVRVFINIIDNSIKYGDINSNIRLKLSVKDEMCFVLVEDKGKGIPKEKINNIFQPFYRVDKTFSREQGSSGLGLFIVKNILDEHGGEINIESEENIGTKVIVRIPYLS